MRRSLVSSHKPQCRRVSLCVVARRAFRIYRSKEEQYTIAGQCQSRVTPHLESPANQQQLLVQKLR
jgi:hypothetical protein